jgi:two-component system chemotaxis response regulator CheB
VVRDTIVIGASAGGIDALSRLVLQFPSDLPAAVLVVIHLSAHAPSFLPAILSRKGPLRARAPAPGDGELPARSRIYCALPDHHLELEDDRVRSLRGPRVNGHRPAIDVLFRSSARARGDRVIGVVLTGFLDDGVGGLREIRRHGGVAVVQLPEDAAHPDLPENAISGAGADHIVTLPDMGGLLIRLLDEPASDRGRSLPKKG